MDRLEYAEKARELLDRARVSRRSLAEEAGISPATLDTVLGPASADRASKLPRYLKSISLALERKSRELADLAEELRKLSNEPPSEVST